ncbi:hypothetical protein GQF61_17395 [Sphingobacterium sp. DK4209]|uniref:Uncharacterized protein n=1 Tax=Sphingobacterium zhuxiongii TaxID=2662364 RepID=A0A5Q0QC39_9SPHI|nr:MULTISPECIES: hypothetical protein [unclassified Sphingobacterium]MVZ67624.1 hypothetical protein [Sphingobacterium sp. DK4209]QGA27143.1 hypothetical protein GFH32_12810 [Sphingobacterium sp. dk4302]
MGNQTAKASGFFLQLATLMVLTLFVLLSSCPIKSSIKSLAGIPFNSEQSSAKVNQNLVQLPATQCVSVDMSTIQQIIKISAKVKQLNPVLPFITSVLFFSAMLFKLNRSLQTYHSEQHFNTPPIFLRDRKLLI